MYPHQKYPSGYKTYAQYPESAVPQSPFDVAYGSSLLPRQLLVSSPFVQVASPLPSPGHHHFPYRGGPRSVGNGPAYMIAAPPLKLSLPPENRKRGLKHQHHLQQQQQQQQHNDIETPVKPKYKSVSSSTSSLDESTFDIQLGRNVSSGNFADDGIPAHLYSNPALQSSSSSLYQLHSSQTQLHGSAFQTSKVPTRSIMLMNVDPELSLSSFLDFITFGPLEGCRLVENYPEDGTNTICLTFLKLDTCLSFYNSLLGYAARFKKLINSPSLSISFVLCKKLLPFISNAINNDGATRNVYIGNLHTLGKLITREFLTAEFSKFGIIEKIDLIQRPFPDSFKEEQDESGENTVNEDGQNELGNDSTVEIFAFIHFTSIASAIKAVEQLSLNTFWHPCKIFYGTDRCSMQNDTLSKSLTDETPFDQDEEGVASDRYFESGFIREEDESDMSMVQYFYPQHFPHSEEDITTALNQKSQAVMAVASTVGGSQNIGNRTICLGNLDQKTKVEDICNVVRGGILQNIRHIQEKRICFLTFIEPASAAHFFANANMHPIILHGRRVQVGWGRHSGSVPNSIALAVTVGASRNVYIGIREEDLENPMAQLPDEETLRADFADFGEIEQVNYFKQNRCVFLNFHNILAAMKVVDDANGVNSEGFHEHFGGRFENFKISFGKDRCGNPPKAKKKKNRKKKNRVDADETRELGDVESQQVVEEVPADLFASMGITADADHVDEADETDHEVSQETGALGITTTTTTTTTSVPDTISDSTETEKKQNGGNEFGIPDYASISSSDTSESEIIFTKPQPSFKDQRRGSHSEKPYKPSQPQINKYKKAQSFSPQVGSRASSRASSRVSSHASLNSLYFAREPEQMYYKTVPFAPPVIPGRSAYAAPSHGGFRSQHPAFSTNGSQVMAQYLAQSQHANMVYAANVLNADVDYFEDEYGNGYRRTGRVRRK